MLEDFVIVPSPSLISTVQPLLGQIDEMLEDFVIIPSPSLISTVQPFLGQIDEMLEDFVIVPSYSLISTVQPLLGQIDEMLEDFVFVPSLGPLTHALILDLLDFLEGHAHHMFSEVQVLSQDLQIFDETWCRFTFQTEEYILHNGFIKSKAIQLFD